MVVERSVGKSNSDFDALDVDLNAADMRPQKFALAYREGHVHRVLANDQGERTAVGADDIACGNIGSADFAGNWRDDIGVAKIDVRSIEIGLVSKYRTLGLLVRRKRLVARNCRSGAFCQQIFRPLQLDYSQDFGSLGALQSTLCLFNRGLK